jgi:protein TonB
MRYHPRWRKAIASSIIFHILFWGIVGWLARDFFTPLDPETYIELELLTDAAAAGPKSNDASSAAQDTQQAAATQLAPTSVMKSTSSMVSSAVPKVVAITDELAVVAVEASASQSSSDYEQENTSPATGTTGGGSVNESGKGTTASNGGGGSGKSGNGSGNSSGTTQITRPSILSKVEPTYPEAARMAGLQGTVQVKIQILANGLPGEVTVNSTSGQNSLDEAAIEAVRQWRFIPAKNREGVNIMCYTTIPIVFHLR